MEINLELMQSDTKVLYTLKTKKTKQKMGNRNGNGNEGKFLERKGCEKILKQSGIFRDWLHLCN